MNSFNVIIRYLPQYFITYYSEYFFKQYIYSKVFLQSIFPGKTKCNLFILYLQSVQFFTILYVVHKSIHTYFFFKYIKNKERWILSIVINIYMYILSIAVVFIVYSRVFDKLLNGKKKIINNWAKSTFGHSWFLYRVGP